MYLKNGFLLILVTGGCTLFFFKSDFPTLQPSFTTLIDIFSKVVFPMLQCWNDIFEKPTSYASIFSITIFAYISI
jgi:hypothetical protein